MADLVLGRRGFQVESDNSENLKAPIPLCFAKVMSVLAQQELGENVPSRLHDSAMIIDMSETELEIFDSLQSFVAALESMKDDLERSYDGSRAPLTNQEDMDYRILALRGVKTLAEGYEKNRMFSEKQRELAEAARKNLASAFNLLMMGDVLTALSSFPAPNGVAPRQPHTAADKVTLAIEKIEKLAAAREE